MEKNQVAKAVEQAMPPVPQVQQAPNPLSPFARRALDKVSEQRNAALNDLALANTTIDMLMQELETMKVVMGSLTDELQKLREAGKDKADAAAGE